MPLRPWFTHIWAHPIFHSSPRGRIGRVRGGNRSYTKGMKQLLPEEQWGLFSLEKGWRGWERRWLKYRSLWDQKQHGLKKLGVNYSPTFPVEKLRAGDEVSKIQIQTGHWRWFVWQWVGRHRSIFGKEYCGHKKSAADTREGWTGAGGGIC